MDYLTIALILIGVGVFLLITEILLPTGGILVVFALLFFAVAVGIILDRGSTTEAVVALLGLAVGLPAAGYVAVVAWRRMSLDTVLDDAQATPPVVPTGEVETLKGRTGKSVSPLRPGGIVEFDGKRFDALTEGTMLDAGVWVRCVDVKWGQVIVRQMEAPSDVAEINPNASIPPPLPEPQSTSEPKNIETNKNDLDDFDIGLDKP